MTLVDPNKEMVSAAIVGWLSPERYRETVDADGKDCNDYAFIAAREHTGALMASVLDERGEGHMIAMLPDGSACWDNRRPSPLTWRELQLLGYRPVCRQTTPGANTWETFA